MSKKADAWAVVNALGEFRVYRFHGDALKDDFGEIRPLVFATSEAEVRALRKVYRAAVKWWRSLADPKAKTDWATHHALKDAIAAASYSLKPHNKKGGKKK